MGLYTLAITLHLARKRFGGVKSGRASGKRFIANATQDGLPDDMVIASRHYNNAFELPTLYYAVALAIVAGGYSDMIFAGLAYGFVGARVVHSVIHLGYNNVMHRFMAFGTSLLFLAALVVRLTLIVAGLV